TDVAERHIIRPSSKWRVASGSSRRYCAGKRKCARAGSSAYPGHAPRFWDFFGSRDGSGSFGSRDNSDRPTTRRKSSLTLVVSDPTYRLLERKRTALLPGAVEGGVIAHRRAGRGDARVELQILCGGRRCDFFAQSLRRAPNARRAKRIALCREHRGDVRAR